jgi:hypothetical protein
MNDDMHKRLQQFGLPIIPNPHETKDATMKDDLDVHKAGIWCFCWYCSRR